MNLNGGNARLVGDGSKTGAHLRGEIAYVRRDSFWIEHDDKNNGGGPDGEAGDGSGAIILENFGGPTDGREDRTSTRRSLSRVLALTVGAFALGIVVSPLVRTRHVPPSGPAAAAAVAPPAIQPPAAPAAPAAIAEPPAPALVAVPAPASAEPPAAAQAAPVVAPPSPAPVTAAPDVSKGEDTDSKPAPVVPPRSAVRGRTAPALGGTSSSVIGASRAQPKKSPAADAATPREIKKASDNKPASDDATKDTPKDTPKKDRAAPATAPKPVAKPWVDPWAATFTVVAARIG